MCFVSSTIYPVLAGADIPYVGGAQVQQTLVARELRARGYRVSVLTGDYGVSDATTADGIELYHLPPKGNRGIKGLRLIHPRLTDIVARLRAISPDVVYARGASGAVAACAWYARLAGRKAVFAAASDVDLLPGRIRGYRRLLDAFLYGWGVRRCDAVAVQNLVQLKECRRRFRRTAVVIPNCYQESGYRPGVFEGPILWVGTVKSIKQPEHFLDLAARHPGRRFVMVGGPSSTSPARLEYYRTIEERARGLTNVEMTGFVPFAEVGRYFDGAAVLVNTSPAEGFPNTFLQAWIRGVPTLSYVAPVTTDAPTATIACGSLDALDARLAALLLATCEDWERASAAVRRHFEAHHGVERVIPMYDQLFDAKRG